MEFLYGILGFLISTIGDYKVIKSLKEENEDLKKKNCDLVFERNELKLAVEKFGNKEAENE